MARPGIKPRTSDLLVRSPTDCTMWPGLNNGESFLNDGQGAVRQAVLHTDKSRFVIVYDFQDFQFLFSF